MELKSWLVVSVVSVRVREQLESIGRLERQVRVKVFVGLSKKYVMVSRYYVTPAAEGFVGWRGVDGLNPETGGWVESAWWGEFGVVERVRC